MYEIVKNYRDNAKLRKSFNNLAKKTFGLDFEDWYENGFWREHYVPYSMVQGEEIVANVSVNLMDMEWKGEKCHLIQLGTVMTDEAYRNQGLIRRLMQEIEADYAEQVDGMYLFANDEVLEFYPRFGYRKAKEYQYSKNVQQTEKISAVQVPMNTKEQWAVLEEAIRNSKNHSCFEMRKNGGLYLFYVSKFMQENVYYIEALDAYAIAEMDEGELLLHAYFSSQEVTWEKIVEAFGDEVEKVTFGFTPLETADCQRRERKEEDTTLFVKGTVFEEFEKEMLMFPTLSHA